MRFLNKPNGPVAVLEHAAFPHWIIKIPREVGKRTIEYTDKDNNVQSLTIPQSERANCSRVKKSYEINGTYDLNTLIWWHPQRVRAPEKYLIAHNPEENRPETDQFYTVIARRVETPPLTRTLIDQERSDVNPNILCPTTYLANQEQNIRQDKAGFHQLVELTEQLNLSDMHPGNYTWDQKNGYTILDTEDMHLRKYEQLKNKWFSGFRTWRQEQIDKRDTLRSLQKSLTIKDGTGRICNNLNADPKFLRNKIWWANLKVAHLNPAVLASEAGLIIITGLAIRHIWYTRKVKRHVAALSRAIKAQIKQTGEIREEHLEDLLKKHSPHQREKNKKPRIREHVLATRIAEAHKQDKKSDQALRNAEQALCRFWKSDYSLLTKISRLFKKRR